MPVALFYFLHKTETTEVCLSSLTRKPKEIVQFVLQQQIADLVVKHEQRTETKQPLWNFHGFVHTEQI